MAPSIRFTLLGLYLALVLPLPALAPDALQLPLAGAVVLGLLLVLAITSERVEIDAQGLRLRHPAWCAWLLQRGWSLEWGQVRGLTPVATSQGGRVFYVRTAAGPSVLLPQRVAGFASFLEAFSRHSGLETRSIGRISPPWTYRLLAALVGLMLLGEAVPLVAGLSPG